MPRYVVRYGATRMLGLMSSGHYDVYTRGAKVIARTDRGQEVGEVLCEATDANSSKLGEVGRGQILRVMAEGDRSEAAKAQAGAPGEFAQVREIVGESGLEMKLVDVERIFGGERVIVYYLAEQRVDFRELVKKLTDALGTRVEMRQIGVRDEAKLLADYGDCGKPVCCNTHLSEMPPVSMKMAKLQRTTLDPNKISGRCGRLKCCLRYEYDVYLDLQKELPRIGADVVTTRGRGRVLGQEILASQVLVELEDHRRVLVNASDVLTVLQRGKSQNPETSDPGEIE